MRKVTGTIATLSLGLMFVVSAADTDDSDFRQALLGSWRSEGVTETSTSTREVTTYLPEGKVNWVGAVTVAGRTVNFVASGTWKVKDATIPAVQSRSHSIKERKVISSKRVGQIIQQ